MTKFGPKWSSWRGTGGLPRPTPGLPSWQSVDPRTALMASGSAWMALRIPWEITKLQSSSHRLGQAASWRWTTAATFWSRGSASPTSTWRTRPRRPPSATTSSSYPTVCWRWINPSNYSTWKSSSKMLTGKWKDNSQRGTSWRLRWVVTSRRYQRRHCFARSRVRLQAISASTQHTLIQNKRYIRDHFKFHCRTPFRFYCYNSLMIKGTRGNNFGIFLYLPCSPLPVFLHSNYSGL